MKNKTILYSIVVFLFITLISCITTTKKVELNEQIYFNFNNNLESYRLLYNFSYNTKIKRETFWTSGKYNNDFAIHQMHIPYESLLEAIKELPKTDIPLEDYDYAFVNDCKDTIYSNYCLDYWEVRKNNKSIYYFFPDSLKIKNNKGDLNDIIYGDNFLKKSDCFK